MTTNSATVSGHDYFSTGDTRLSLVVSRAALELDHAARGRPVTFTAVRSLGHFLETSFEVSLDNLAAVQKNLDDATIVVVGRSLGAESRTVRDVVTTAQQIAGTMARTDRDTESAELLKLRDFCIALSNNLVSYRESFSEQRPSSRFRR